MGKPHAVVVTTTLPARPGDGTPEFVLTLARAIRAFDVAVVAPNVPGADRHTTVDGVQLRRVRYFPARWEGLAADAIMPTLRAQPWRVIEVPFMLAALTWATWREVRRRKAVVINAHWIVPAGLVAMLVGWVTRVPYVLTVHGADAYALKGRLAGALKRLVISRASAVLPVSEDIRATLGLAADVPVLRMGVDTDAVRAAVEPREPEPGLIVGIGRLADKKGFDVLLDALVDVPGARVELLGDGPERQALESRARSSGLADRVVFRGRVGKAEVLRTLSRAGVVVIPSVVGAGGDMEGTPVVLCEAMAAGVPVVASELGGLAECVVDGKTGLLVAPGDVDALAAALRAVCDGEVDGAGMGAAAADESRRSLDIRTVGEAYDRVMTDLTAGR